MKLHLSMFYIYFIFETSKMEQWSLENEDKIFIKALSASFSGNQSLTKINLQKTLKNAAACFTQKGHESKV